MANGIWSSKSETTRGGGESRAFHLATAKGYWNGKTYEGPLTHGRRYSKEELWENFGTFDGYVRALEIANSSNIGVCLCCGTWAEGGDDTGKNIYEAARAFAKMGKLWKIHFRNVTSPVPNFVETYIDNGYNDMRKLMKTLVDIEFRAKPHSRPRAADGRCSQICLVLQYGVHPRAI